LKYKKYFRKTSLKQKSDGAFFLEEIKRKKPKFFLEVGVFHGVTARNVCELLFEIHNHDFKYIGLDLFKKNQENESEIIPNTNFSNPLKWADPDGYAYIENSKGTTILDKNFVQIFPGRTPSNNFSNVKVVPNPYVSRSRFKESEFQRKIRFTNLPPKCTIKIFTISGELVYVLEHDNEKSGNEWWDMRTLNNQEIAPGLYLFHIERKDNKNGKGEKELVGKFAVLR